MEPGPVFEFARDLRALRAATRASPQGSGELAENNAYGWRCSADTNALDVRDACLKLYGSTPPVARFQNFADPNSWQCWDDPRRSRAFRTGAAFLSGRNRPDRRFG